MSTTNTHASPFAWLVPRKELRKHLAVMNNFVEPFIDEALLLSPDELEKRTKSDDGYTFLHAIAAFSRDRKMLRDQLVAVLLAGRDTTACTLSWLFHQLGNNPDVVAELRKEIEQVVGLSQQPTYENLKSMRYLSVRNFSRPLLNRHLCTEPAQACLHETLRLYPVVPYNVRVALKDTSLPRGGGPDGMSPIGVPKGTPIRKYNSSARLILATATHLPIQHTRRTTCSSSQASTLPRPKTSPTPSSSPHAAG